MAHLDLGMLLDENGVGIYSGDPWSWPITETQDNGDGTTSPIDLIAKYGSTWTCQLRYSPAADPPITVSVDTSVASSDGTVTLSISDTTALQPGVTYWGDVQVTGGAGGSVTPYRFRVPVTKDVTR